MRSTECSAENRYARPAYARKQMPTLLREAFVNPDIVDLVRRLLQKDKPFTLASVVASLTPRLLLP